MNRAIPKAPAEGWISLVLVVVMCLTLAWSIDDVRLVLGSDGYTDFLGPMAILGVLVAFIGAKVGWGRWLTYLIGATFAALIVPLVVGVQLEYDPALGYIDAFRASGATWVEAVLDLTVRAEQSTSEYGHYMVFLGLLVWATSMFAGFAVFGHRRPLNAIVVVGLLLLVNMALTPADQVGYLVLFSIAALALLVRFHILDEQAEWVRRRIGDPASISSVYLRGGSIFIAVAVVGSILLMNVATSAPLQGSWAGFSGAFVELSRSIQRIVPVGGNSRPIGSDFDPSSTKISGKWLPNDALIATIKLPVTDKTDYYWRATTFDEFTLNSWIANAPDEMVQVDAGEPLLLGTEEAANRLGVDGEGTALGTTDITFTVDPASGDPILLSPLTPLTVDVRADVSLIGEPGTINAILRREDGPYTVTARIRLTGNDPGEFSVAALQNAGTDYPEDIETRYTDVPEGAIPEGGAAEALLDQLIEEGPGTDNPYDFAAYLQRRFLPAIKDGGLFTYDPDILDLMDRECKDISVVECFAKYQRGSCQFYASTMAIFLREEGIPARVVEGFLPSDRSAQGVEVINGIGQHQWVEVYFPGYGWYGFDPTGGGRSQQQVLPAGVAGPSLAPLAPGGITTPTRRPELDEPDNGVTDASGRTRIPVGGLIAVALLLAVIVGGLVFVAWQRGPRSGTSADGAYRTVTRLASRFGFGPRPDQTVYEYAGTLGEVLPVMRPELETVAQAKVETVYGRGLLGEDRLLALRQAERRLRLNLLRLAFRRKDRRRR